MGMIINVHDAKTYFSKYLEKVEQGEEVIIGKHGKPVAKLVAIPSQKPRKPGALKHSLWIAEDFDKMPKSWSDAVKEDLDAHTD